MRSSKTIFDMGKNLHKIKDLRWTGGLGDLLIRRYAKDLVNQMQSLSAPLHSQLKANTQFTPSGQGTYFSFTTPSIRPQAFYQTITFSGIHTNPYRVATRRDIEKMKKSKIHPRWVIHISNDRPVYLGHLGCPEGVRRLQEGRYYVKTSANYTYIGRTSVPDSEKYIYKKVDCCSLCKTKIPKEVKFFINMLRVEI